MFVGLVCLDQRYLTLSDTLVSITAASAGQFLPQLPEGGTKLLAESQSGAGPTRAAAGLNLWTPGTKPDF